jgi:hypothetical protein
LFTFYSTTSFNERTSLDQLDSTSTRTPSSEIYSQYSSNHHIIPNTLSTTKKLFPFKPTLNYTPASVTRVQEYGNSSPLIKTSSLNNDVIQTTFDPLLTRNSLQHKSTGTLFFLLSSISMKTNKLSKDESITILEEDVNTTPLMKTSSSDKSFFTKPIQTLIRGYSDMNIFKQYTRGMNNIIQYNTSLNTTVSDELVSYVRTETPETSTLINHNSSHQIIQSTSYLG